MFKERKVSRLSIPGWEAVYRCELRPGILALIAIHNTSRGSSLGGCRLAPYDSESQAITDVLRLSRGMTYKNAAANLPLGGGKAVIMGNPKIRGKSRQAILREFGKFVAWVNRDEDRYYTAEDMNTTVEDMHIVKEQTRHIFGIKIDPSPYTAGGVFNAIEHTVDYFAADLFDGKRRLKNKKVLVQGLGKVGMSLLEPLHKAGTRILFCDTGEAVVKEALEKYPESTIVDPRRCLEQDVDVFVPCARGEVVNSSQMNTVKFKIICGAANNQLQNPATGHLLHQQGVVYCPDYIANMGGVCSIHYLERERLSKDKARRKIKTTVKKMLSKTFQASRDNNLPFNAAADLVVEEIVWGRSPYEWKRAV